MNKNENTNKKTKKNMKKVQNIKKETGVKEISIEPIKEEKKEEEVREITFGLNRKAQNNYRTLTKIVTVLAIIGRVLITIAIPLVLIAAIFFTFILNKIEYSNNTITFNNQEVAQFVNDEDGLSLVVNTTFDNKDITLRDNIGLSKIQSFFETVPKGVLISTIIFGATIVEAVLVVWLFIYHSLEKLFNNLNTKETPFIEDNALLIRSIARLLIIHALVVSLGSGILGLLVHAGITLSYSTTSIIGILAIYVLYYIFKYGIKLQSKTNMCIIK